MKDRIVVDFGACERIARSLSQAEGELHSAMSMLNGLGLTEEAGAFLRISSNCSLRTVGIGVHADTVSQAVSSYRNAIGRVSDYSRSLSQAVRWSAEHFQEAERGSLAEFSNASVGDAAPKSEGGEPPAANTPFQLFNISDLWKLVGQFGIIGSGISVIGGLITGGITVSSVLTALKGTSSFLEKTFKAASTPSFDWKTLFGFNPIDLDKASSNYFTEFGNQLGKYKFGDGANTASKLSTVAKWAGAAFTFATTAYDNYGDYQSGEMGAGRAVAETFSETGVKILEGVALTAGVTAVCAAAGVAAPAVVVGGTVVIATWAIDRVSEALTGQDFAENVSDFVLDRVGDSFHRAVEDISSLGRNVGTLAHRAGNRISGWWNSRFGGALLAGGGSW